MSYVIRRRFECLAARVHNSRNAWQTKMVNEELTMVGLLEFVKTFRTKCCDSVKWRKAKPDETKYQSREMHP